jgi:hypothetical protein
MNDREREALEALRVNINLVEGADDVWRPFRVHVEGMNRHVERGIHTGIAEAVNSTGGSPIGLILQGQRGAGKTHLIGWARERIQHESGYFFLIGLLDARTFWESTVAALLDGLSRDGVDGESQLKIFLRRLSTLVAPPRWVQREVIGNRAVSRHGLDAFVGTVRNAYPQVGLDARDILRALVLRASPDLGTQDVGDAYLLSSQEGEPGERAAWGMRPEWRSPQEVVRDISRLLALTGPSLVAVDQIDTLVAQSAMSTDSGQAQGWHELIALEQVAGGLMALREVTRRTLTVVSCLPQTWVLIEKYATDSVQDRFRTPVLLKTIPSPEVGRALVEKRFAVRFAEIGFVPPYPSWPVLPSAFEAAPEFTPRGLLQKIDRHIDACLLDDEVREMESLDQAVAARSGLASPPPAVDLTALDRRFAELKEHAQVSSAVEPTTEDATLPALLAAGLSAWIVELGAVGRAFGIDPPPSRKPSLHARLRQTLDEATEDEAHWAFRGIGAHHPVAALSRLRSASLAAGLNAEVPKRRLFVLRNEPWSKGPRTLEAVAAFEKAGGRVLKVSEEDLRILTALRDLQAENPPSLRAWLAARRPTTEIELFRAALDDAGTRPDGSVTEPAATVPGLGVSPVPGAGPAGPGRASAPPRAADGGPVGGTWDAAEGPGQGGAGGHGPGEVPTAGPYILLGRTVADAQPVTLDLGALSRHTAVFAGSGSGKTVLIRRLVEECALHGVSAIVLDPNNDLARLGDAWPEAPPQWGPGDAEKAADYLAGTDVVVWTPNREAGRPLGFQPLPDLAAIADDPDEFRAAVDVAVASLVPRARLDGRTAKAQLGRAVLREAVEHYGRRGVRTGLKGLIAVLADLPYGVSSIGNAERIAADLAQILTAAMVTDPLFGGVGTAVDPGVLLTPAPGRRARVSVVNLDGLPSDEQRQGFVNQLQMALFAWIKKHPARDRPLGGLFVMDEAQTFAPSGAMTACTQSTLALASQARKYGLGLVFATQAPKGLHNRIPGNAATQFFGLLNAPVQIAAAQEMARAKGGRADDVSRLSTGEFYLATEESVPVKVSTPLCLSHHPKAPLTANEVIERATAP